MNKSEDKAEHSLRLAALARLSEVAVAAMTRLPAASLRGSGRGRRPVARARQVAMYLAHVGFGLSLTRVGICFGRDRTTVRHACALIEDRRDDPALELALAAIEAGLCALTARLAVAEPMEARP